MNLKWAQYWIGLFADSTDELMTLYDPGIQFEDVNFGLQINGDLASLIHDGAVAGYSAPALLQWA